MIVVIAGIIEKDGKILIARRGKGSHQEGLWEFPGGKIEVGETDEECLERELREELSIETRTKDFVAESVFQYPGKDVCQIKAYRSEWLSGDIVLTEHMEIAWVSLSDMNAYEFVAADVVIVEALK